MGICSVAHAQKQTAVFDGIEIGFEMSHVDGANPSAPFREGDDAIFRFTIRDTLSGNGISGASPGAWMEPSRRNSRADVYDCGQLLTSFLSGSMFSRAELDLNVFYVLALNNDASVSVVDPLFSFGGTKLLAIIPLQSVGMDWEITPKQDLIYVSQPQAGSVAMISAADWSVRKHIPLNAQPNQLLMQPDGQYLWAEFSSGKIEGYSGVAAISAADGNLVGSVTTGEGDHALAISGDSRYLFVTNPRSGTVSIVDPNRMVKSSDVSLDGTPGLIAWSEKAKAAYVSDPETGKVWVIDARSGQVVTEFSSLPGASHLAFEPTGRFAFLVYPESDRIQILDAASNRIVQTGDTESQPMKVYFSAELAYVVHAGSEEVLMFPLDNIGKEGMPLQAAEFPGGQNPSALSEQPCEGPLMVQAPGTSAMLLANPNDKMVYYYMEGMAAPRGNFSNYNRRPRSVAVIDRSLKEVSPGTYETIARIRGHGPYRIPFFLDAPRIVHCFEAEIGENPTLEKERAMDKLGTVSIQFFRGALEVKANEEFKVFVEMKDPLSGDALTGLQDVRFRATSPSNWFEEVPSAESEVAGIYGGKFIFPEPGAYYIRAECPSHKLDFNNPQYLVLRVK
ncbi:MAG: YncE family protein [Bacteroidia bacterium]|nr:YncE family protein [Bacteroidia bacterium]